MNILSNLGVAAILFVFIWIASSGIIGGVTKLSLKAKLPPFLVSFVLLGLLTSSTEISLAINSHINGLPEVSVGNLIGGIIVIFLLVIPVLAVFGNGIGTENNYSKLELLFTLAMITLPALFLFDGIISASESTLLIAGYLIPVIILVIRHHGVPKKKGRKPNSIKNTNISRELFKIVIAGGTLLFASDRLIDVVVSSANEMSISPFLISLLTLSIGTNLPEIVLVIRAVLSGQKDIALGNYIGSALANLFILGVLASVNTNMPITANFTKILFFTVIGIALFFIFINTKKQLSRKEGLVLLGIYAIFVATELINI